MILGRNELAKWQKLNSAHIDLPRRTLFVNEKANAIIEDDLDGNEENHKRPEDIED